MCGKVQGTLSGYSSGGLQVDHSSTGHGAEARRLKLINITDSIEKRILNLFSLLEKDILSAVHSDNMQISPYSPVYVMH